MSILGAIQGKNGQEKRATKRILWGRAKFPADSRGRGGRFYSPVDRSPDSSVA